MDKKKLFHVLSICNIVALLKPNLSQSEGETTRIMSKMNEYRKRIITDTLSVYLHPNHILFDEETMSFIESIVELSEGYEGVLTPFEKKRGGAYNQSELLCALMKHAKALDAILYLI